MDLKEQFDASIDKAKGLPNQSNDTLLELYGLFKQATIGDAEGERPSGFDFPGKNGVGCRPTRRCRRISTLSIDSSQTEKG